MSAEDATNYISLVRMLWENEPRYLFLRNRNERLWHLPQGLNHGKNLLDILLGIYHDLGIECRLECTISPSEETDLKETNDHSIIPPDQGLYLLTHQDGEVKLKDVHASCIWVGIPSLVAHRTNIENYPLITHWILLMEKFMAYRYPKSGQSQKS